MVRSQSRALLAERLITALVVLVVASWVLGLLSPWIAPLGSLPAGFVFIRMKAGLRKKPPYLGAFQSSAAISVLLIPVLLSTWFLVTATSEPDHNENFVQALVNFEGDGGTVASMGGFYVAAVVFAAIGGALAAWSHGRLLDREYWVNEE